MLQMVTYILYRFTSILEQDSEVLFIHNLNLNNKLNIVYYDILVKIIILYLLGIIFIIYNYDNIYYIYMFFRTQQLKLY